MTKFTRFQLCFNRFVYRMSQEFQVRAKIFLCVQKVTWTIFGVGRIFGVARRPRRHYINRFLEIPFVIFLKCFDVCWRKICVILQVRSIWAPKRRNSTRFCNWFRGFSNSKILNFWKKSKIFLKIMFSTKFTLYFSLRELYLKSSQYRGAWTIL